MKTTVLIDDDLYREIVPLAAKKYKNLKSLSRIVNDALREFVEKRRVPKSMFGAFPDMSYEGMRDKRDRL